MVSLCAALTSGDLCWFPTAHTWLRTGGVLASAMAASVPVRLGGAQGSVCGQVSIIDRPGATGGGTIKQAELLFARLVPAQGRVRREGFVLIWEAAQVGQILSEAATVRSRTGTIAMQ